MGSEKFHVRVGHTVTGGCTQVFPTQQDMEKVSGKAEQRRVPPAGLNVQHVWTHWAKLGQEHIYVASPFSFVSLDQLL